MARSFDERKPRSERRAALDIVFAAVIIAVALYMLVRNISYFSA